MKTGINLPRIFIIDDDVTDCHFMSQCLARAGYRTDFSTDGREGLANILQNVPQCLIINVILPGRSGYAICRHLRTIYSHNTLPIIAVSTTNTSLDQNYAFKIGVNHYLLKPFTEEVLVQTVRRVLPKLSPIVMATQILPPPMVPNAPASLMMSTLIPYRQDEVDMMLRDNPFARASVITDRQLRRLYALIDGGKTVQDLAELIQQDLQSTLRLLKALWRQQHIAFYDMNGHTLKDMSIFDSIN